MVWLTLALSVVPATALAQSIEQLFQQGNAAQAARRFPEAEAIWREVIQRNPKNAIAYNNLGIALANQQKLDAAIAAYRTAIQLDPKYAAVYYNLGIALANQQKLDAAIAAYRTAIQLDPKDAAAYNNLGLALANQQKLDAAIAAFRTAIQLDPKYAVAYYNLGNALKDQQKLDAAIAAFRTAIQLDPKDAVAYNNLGIALANQQKLDAAIAAFRTAIQLDPKYAAAYNNLGNALKDQQKLDAAIAAYRTAIQLDPKYAAAYNNLGNALKDQQKLDAAIAAFRTAIQLDPNFAAAYNNLGLALANQQKLDAAIAAYRKALSLPESTSGSPTTAHTLAHNNLGLALQEQGKLEDAIREFEQAVKLDPNFSFAENNLKEARRLLALKRNPQPTIIDDTAYLPNLDQEPKLPVFRSTARIITPITEGSSIAAGWVVKRQGNIAWIVTNRHVVTDPRTKRLVEKPLQVEFFSDLPEEKRPRYTAKILHVTPNTDDELDLAVLQITDDRLPKDIQPLIWNTDRLQANQRIYVIGHPYNKDNPWDSASGEVTSSMQQGALLPIDAIVATGNSGGPVINERNQVIGVFVAIRSKSTFSASAMNNSSNLADVSPATGEIGLAYRINVVIERLRRWKVLD
jgi:superkiller protein 3